MKDISNRIFDIAIIGAGPAGSTAAISLSRHGISTCLVEKKKFPRETLCGEFLSKEVTDIVSGLGLAEKFNLLNPNPISSVKFSYKDEKPVHTGLGFTGYGLMRGKFDKLLIDEAKRSGSTLLQPYEVSGIVRTDGYYQLSCIKKGSAGQNEKIIKANRVLCAYGKQNHLDRSLVRSFIWEKSNLNGIKIHLPLKYLNSFDCREIHLYSGDMIYCGINAVGEDLAAVCLLEHRLPGGGHRFTGLKKLLEANFSFRQMVDPSALSIIDKLPYYGIGNIYFGKRDLVSDGIFMLGDAAHVIAPLAGDGIAMAMQSAEILSNILIGTKNDNNSRSIENLYIEKWNKSFKKRIITAGTVQKLLLGHSFNTYIPILKVLFPFVLKRLITLTRS